MIELRDVELRYDDTVALRDVDLELPAGEFAIVRGPSGSGKSTLLLTIGGMLRPTRGSVRFQGHDLYAIDERARGRLRGTDIGFVFQMFHLVPYLDLVQNVLLAGGDGATRSPERIDRARATLERVGLQDRMHHTPAELSAGERQRVAVGRALFHEPKLVLADEPTGNLDPDNADAVLDLLSEFHQGGGTVILVTHARAGDDRATAHYALECGRLAAAART